MSETLSRHAEAEHLRPGQALVIRADGTAEVVFLGVVHGRELRGTYRGHDWAAYEAHGEHEPNEVATAFARSLGMTGALLHGTVVFTGVGDTADVPGVLLKQIIRFVGEVALN